MHLDICKPARNHHQIKIINMSIISKSFFTLCVCVYMIKTLTIQSTFLAKFISAQCSYVRYCFAFSII